MVCDFCDTCYTLLDRPIVRHLFARLQITHTVLCTD